MGSSPKESRIASSVEGQTKLIIVMITNLKYFFCMTGLVVGLMACNQMSLTPGPDMGIDKIQFVAGGPAVDYEITTKATVNTATQLADNGFIANAVKGSAGSDVEVWSNQAFTKVGDVWEQDKWWPNDNQSYRFYAVYPGSYTTTFAAGGPTIAATNANDILCAYKGNATYKSVNTLSFEHIFARLCDVTVSPVSPYTISGITINITPKTGGTYNLYTGAGQSDGTGWSSTTNGSATNIANATSGTKSNDIYLVPGSYTLTATWTATKDNYSQTFSNITKNVSLVGGMRNNITVSFTGNGMEIQFGVSVEAWGTEAVVAGEWPLKNVPQAIGQFTINEGGDKVGFAPGNLQCTVASGPTDTYNYTGSDWCFADNQWDYLGSTDSANSFTVGKKMDLFGWVGASASYETYGLCSNTDANNAYYGTGGSDALKTDWGDIPGVVSALGSGWFTLTTVQWGYVFDTRNGGTVGGTSRVRWTQGIIRTDVSGVKGIILFPDGCSIAADEFTTLGTLNAASAWGTRCTAAQWTALEAKGCVFLPVAGYRNGTGVNDVGSSGYYWSSSVDSETTARRVYFYSGTVNPVKYMLYRSFGFSVRLAKQLN